MYIIKTNSAQGSYACKKPSHGIILIKPQFEQTQYVAKGGVVRCPKLLKGQ
jgi:predicted rRNA methylase YqxC with S4 and FtsJ domains